MTTLTVSFEKTLHKEVPTDASTVTSDDDASSSSTSTAIDLAEIAESCDPNTRKAARALQAARNYADRQMTIQSLRELQRAQNCIYKVDDRSTHSVLQLICAGICQFNLERIGSA